MTHSPHEVHVSLGEHSYDVTIGTGNLTDIGRLVVHHGATSHAVVITDENVEKPHATRVAESIAEAGPATDLIVIPPGETSKSIDTAADVWQKLLQLETGRQSVIVAVGGGVVGDLAGFVAATFHRGLSFVQVPTTLLAQVDSAVGGKVGINLPDAKNVVGAFLQPAAVLADTQVLHSLPWREYRAGLAEVVKYGVILDPDFFAYLEDNIQGLCDRDDAVLSHVVQRSCRLKADIVEKDELEKTGLRAVLNYGHTFGHALEAVSGFGQLLHGEAVSIGMLCASRLAERLGRIDAGLTARQASLLESLGLPIEMPEVDHAQLLAAMLYDKKTVDGRPRFVLPTRLGHVELVEDVAESEVEGALAGV